MDFTCWLLIRTWNKQGPPRISAGKVRKVYTKYPQRAAASARISPPEMVPSPDSPPIRIVTSFSIECPLGKSLRPPHQSNYGAAMWKLPGRPQGSIRAMHDVPLLYTASLPRAPSYVVLDCDSRLVMEPFVTIGMQQCPTVKPLLL